MQKKYRIQPERTATNTIGGFTLRHPDGFWIGPDNGLFNTQAAAMNYFVNDVLPHCLGYISIRNEDGTQYLSRDENGVYWVFSKAEATPLPYSEFLEMQTKAEETKKRDCPDNGFFGWYNLRFTLLSST